MANAESRRMSFTSHLSSLPPAHLGHYAAGRDIMFAAEGQHRGRCLGTSGQ